MQHSAWLVSTEAGSAAAALPLFVMGAHAMGEISSSSPPADLAGAQVDLTSWTSSATHFTIVSLDLGFLEISGAERRSSNIFPDLKPPIMVLLAADILAALRASPQI